jgi:hypothetical protein
MPESDQIVADAAKAEEMLAKLQADSELADSVSPAIGGPLSGEEQALFEELSRETAEEEVSEKPAEAKPAASKSKRRAEAEPG